MTPPIRFPASSHSFSHASEPTDPISSPEVSNPKIEQATKDRHHEILRQAFGEQIPTSSSARRFGSPLAYTPWALLGALTGCNNHPPLIGDGDTGGDAGNMDGGRQDSNLGAGGNGGGIDAGNEADGGHGESDAGSSEICQIRLPVAVMFYDCVDMAPAGGPTTRVCFSDQFGGDVAAARSYITRAMDLTREIYTQTCTELQIDPILFFPERVLNGRIGITGLDFSGIDDSADGIDNPMYAHSYYSGRIAADLETLGTDSTGFGAYMVLNGWRSSVIPSAGPQTYNLAHRTSPPYALTAVNLDEGLDPYLQIPGIPRLGLRHELDHALNNIESHFGFDRLPSTHSAHPYCPVEADWTWLCRTEYDGMGNPLRASDWQMLLGATGFPVTCDEPSWQANCAMPETETCDGTPCPPLPHYDNSCNDHGFCEYTPSSPTEPWQAYSTWIYIPPGGTFNMGSESGSPSEIPVTPVTFTRGYFIGKYEVPIEAFEACEAAGECLPRNQENWDGDGWGKNLASERPLHPANYLDYGNAGMVCGFLFPGARLPSHAEWEFAARGPSGLLYPFGESPPTCSRGEANFNETGTADGYGCGTGGTRPIDVGATGASWIGALNMSGNVWEWLGDCWTSDYSSVPTNGFTYNQYNCHQFNLAGGGFNNESNLLRGAQRLSFWHDFDNANVGARCAISASWVYGH